MTTLIDVTPAPSLAFGVRPGYLPIADHGVIGDLRTVALVGVDGTIDWYCPERFDGPSVFGALLDRSRGGYYRIAPVDECSTKQLYLPDTNVLITRFLSSAGVGEVHDFMPVGGQQRLIRRVVCVRGEIPSASSASRASTMRGTTTRPRSPRTGRTSGQANAPWPSEAPSR